MSMKRLLLFLRLQITLKRYAKNVWKKSLTIQALGQLWIMQSVMFPGNVYSPNVVAKYYVMFLWAQELKERSLSFLNFLFFSFVVDYSQTSADDVIISQLQAISQVFSSYPPSGEFCQVSYLTIHEQIIGRQEKCLFGQNWAKIPRRLTSRHLQG